ncbi:MAG: hypothetical protein EXS42_02365 [Lacunisphaera sp.]|nr:hypothetical protein [Lacunisphaera sp.]
MNPEPQSPAPRRYVWRWVLLAAGLCLTPFVLLAIAAVSFLTMDRDAAMLRKHVMAATDAGWHTKVQLSVGSIVLGALRTGLHFVHHKDIEEARQALGAVRHASVGVYERTSGPAGWSRTDLFTDTDQAMNRRGWTRLVGVADHKDTVLIYVPQDLDTDGPVEICLAVVNGKELVVVSASVDASVLAELVKKHTGEDLKSHLYLAKFKL